MSKKVPHYMSSGEVADMLGMPQSTISNHNLRGWLRHSITYGPNGARGYSEADVRKYEKEYLDGQGAKA